MKGRLKMTVREAILKRRSIRRYKENEIIPDEHIKEILTSAMHAPSACNTRPWEFIVLKSKEAREKAAEIHPYAHFVRYGSLGIIVSADETCQEGIAKGYFPQDSGAAIQNMLLCALELGYGSCWCGLYPQEDRVSDFKKVFDIKGTPVALVVIGVSDQEPEARGFYDESKVTVI